MKPGTPFPRDVNFAALDGTSMAAPHVSAAAALIQANSPQPRSPQEINDILRITATRPAAMGGSRWTQDYGYGRLNVPRAINAAKYLQL